MNNITSNKQSGFTLIELVVVVVILGILAAIVIQHINNLNDELEAATCKANQYRIENVALKLYSQKAVLGSPSFVENLMELRSEFDDGKLPECPTHGTYTYHSSYGTVSCDQPNHNRK